MYKKFLNLPIQTKLMSMITTIMLPISFAVFFYFPSQQREQITDTMQTRIKSLTDMLAFGVGIGLRSGDFSTVSKFLDWARQDKDLAYISILDEESFEMAVINPQNMTVDHNELISQSGIVQMNRILFNAVPIQQNDVFYGTVILGFSYQRLDDQITKARVTAIIVGLSVLLIFAVALLVIRKTVINPILRLREAAIKVAQGDMDVEVEILANDEAGQLSKTFNDMVVNIKTVQKQLIVQEKMASLGSLTAGIAHEIKNPLNFVNNFAEGSVELADELQEELDKYKEKFETDDYENITEVLADIRQNVMDIHDNGKRADGIVHGMMDHARGTEGQQRATNINALIDENINLAYHGYRAKESAFNVSIQKKFAEALAPIEVFPQSLGRVLLNIFTNACYAVHQKHKELGSNYSPTITVSTGSENGKLEIRVWDNGPGIPEKIRDKIFNPFFTTKPTGEGNTGLGLSISYDIITQEHGGKIKVESNLGEFTEFVISLPKEGTSNEDRVHK